MLKRVLGSLLCVLSFAVFGNASCPPISCDCASIPNQVWRSDCLKKEQQLNQSCAETQQAGACRMTGVGVQSPDLWVGKLDSNPVVDAQATIEQGQLLSWAVREANTQAMLLQDQGDWRGALAQRRRENSGQLQIYQLAVNLGDFYESQGKVENREFLYSDLIKRNSQEAERVGEAAVALWAARAEGAPEQHAVKLALAERMMRSAGDWMALAADAARRNGDPKQSAVYWQRTAELSVQLLRWKESIGSSAKEQNFYRQRAAARWYQAGLMALVAGDGEMAMAAKQRSETLWAAGT